MNEYIPEKGDIVCFSRAPLQPNRTRPYQIVSVDDEGLVAFRPADRIGFSYLKRLSQLQEIGMYKRVSKREQDPTWDGKDMK